MDRETYLERDAWRDIRREAQAEGHWWERVNGRETLVEGYVHRYT